MAAHLSSRFLLPAAACLALTALVAGGARADEPVTRLAWSEGFRVRPGWGDPSGHGAEELTRVYSVQREGEASWLHARHDAQSGKTPAMHFGHALANDGVPLEKVRALRFKWRVLQHPRVGADPWLDVGASVYVVFEKPGLFSGGKGFKLGWLAKPGPRGTHQRGLLQLALRADPSGPTWQSESVDLCALYRAEYGGGCAGQRVRYVGVVTDADGTKSVAEADYDDFELVLGP